MVQALKSPAGQKELTKAVIDALESAAGQKALIDALKSTMGSRG
ncbi:MAG TPA: hypothetical protein VGW74_12545 [Propionibacteriaceae bacterium]|nr:hypothetical protein [Propionibacteriaceae bacterium]